MNWGKITRIALVSWEKSQQDATEAIKIRERQQQQQLPSVNFRRKVGFY